MKTAATPRQACTVKAVPLIRGRRTASSTGGTVAPRKAKAAGAGTPTAP